MKITSNEKIDRIFLIKSVEVKTTKTGNNYLDLRLTDKDNDVKAKKWGYTGDKPAFDVMTLQRIVGTASNYNGQVQINVTQILPVDKEELDIADYVPCTPLDCDKALSEIYDVIYSFDNEELLQLASTALQQVENEFKYYPAALSMHDACVGGLCHHTYCMIQTALAICKVYPFVNRDLLLTGVILHDLAKIDEIEACELGPKSTYTVSGNLLGHLVMGAIRIDKLCDELNLSDYVRTAVLHMLISHHGKNEYGSAKQPCFLEAMILNAIDDLDAKIFEFFEAVKDVDPGSFGAKNFALGNIQVFKPKI